jgi:P27 family predicted phage terminase small subunit
MGRRGPPPQPAYLKLLAGNPGKRRIQPELAPVTQPAEPLEPPDWLDEGARQEWTRLAPELHRLHLLTVLDVAPFAAYCVSLARWQQTERALATAGGAGVTVQRLTRLAGRERRDAARFGAAFGLGPPNRQRLAGSTPSGGKFSGLLA